MTKRDEPAGTPSLESVEQDFSTPADPDLKPVGDADDGSGTPEDS